MQSGRQKMTRIDKILLAAMLSVSIANAETHLKDRLLESSATVEDEGGTVVDEFDYNLGKASCLKIEVLADIKNWKKRDMKIYTQIKKAKKRCNALLIAKK